MSKLNPQFPTPEPVNAALAPWVQKQFDDLVNKLGHAFLLTGAPGLNQFDLALSLAQAWLCDAPHDATGRACGHCESCHMLKAHTHPDLKMLLPQNIAIEFNWEQAQETDAEDKKRKPSREIRTQALKAMIEFSQRTRARKRGQVVVIYPAERMNQVSANTLLKTLEEPPADMRFILASENAQRLLPTIRSRCQTHIMIWPQEEQALSWLQEQGVKEPQTMLAAAGGKPAQALQMLAQGMDAQKWAQIPQQLAQGSVGVFDTMMPTQMLDIASKLCHDLLSVCVGAKPRFFPQSSLVTKVKEKAVIAWSKEVMQAMQVADHPWNMPLYVQTLVATAQKIMNP